MKVSTHRRLLGLLLVLLPGCGSFGPATSNEPTLLLDNDGLYKIKDQVHSNAETRKQVETLGGMRSGCGPFSVTDKNEIPPSGDKHDYLSYAPYWWPDPGQKGGFPYLKKDGKVNPASERTGDERALQKFTKCLERLSISANLLQDPKIGQVATALVKRWFLEPKTRMNPNLIFAGIIPGSRAVRGVGIEEGREFLRVIDSVNLLRAALFMPGRDLEGIQHWFEEYLKWLLTSKQGAAVAEEGDNVSTIYYAQVVTIALFVGKEEFARKVLSERFSQIVAHQIAPDGSQPAELLRTRSWQYSHTNLRHLFYLARLGDRLNFHPRLWDYQTPDGRSLRKALDFLIPYSTGEKRWSYPQPNNQIDPLDGERIAPLLRMAAVVYRDDKYRALSVQLGKKLGDVDRLWVELGSLNPM